MRKIISTDINYQLNKIISICDIAVEYGFSLSETTPEALENICYLLDTVKDYATKVKELLDNTTVSEVKNYAD